jgi:hypothetical protein
MLVIAPVPVFDRVKPVGVSVVYPTVAPVKVNVPPLAMAGEVRLMLYVNAAG